METRAHTGDSLEGSGAALVVDGDARHSAPNISVRDSRYVSWVPRLLRFRSAPAYLGMNQNLFNELVRPHVKAIPIGKRGIAFDRLELDAWAEEYSRCNGRSAPKREEPQCRNEYPASSRGPKPTAAFSGTSINRTRIMDEFAKALELTMKSRPRGSWRSGSTRSATRTSSVFGRSESSGKRPRDT
jgi:hypothetical protein